MKMLKCISSISIVSVGLSLGSFALADASYDNTAGQSAQLTHTMQDRSREDVKEKRSVRDDRLERVEAVEILRSRNMLGQSDAMSATPAFRPKREAHN